MDVQAGGGDLRVSFSATQRSTRRDGVRWALLLLPALFLAIAGPFPTASWNDGSRLAAVESLVDYGTWRIDESIFVDPSRVVPGTPPPYPPCEPGTAAGTGDKMFIGGHYYSDKSPVPSLLMAGLYKALQGVSGLTARSRPDLFISAMTLATAGVGFIGAVASMHALARRIHPSPDHALAVAASFSLATAAPAFTRQANVHVLLLGVAAALLLALEELRRRLAAGERPWLFAAAVGTLAGFGYGTDLGTGFVLMLTLVPLVAYRCLRLRRGGWKLFGVFLLAALPWVVLHHALNYRIGGSLAPAAADPRHFEWPGSPWAAQAGAPPADELTGRWQHPGILAAAVYAFKFLFGPNGFVLVNPAILLVGPAWILLQRRKPRPPEMPEVLFGAAWALSTWLLYAALSVDKDWSFRWLLPMLAPGYYAIAILLRERPRFWREFLVLTGGGVVIAYNLWQVGPWGAGTPETRTVLWTLLCVWLGRYLFSRLTASKERTA